MDHFKFQKKNNAFYCFIDFKLYCVYDVNNCIVMYEHLKNRQIIN